MTWAPHVTVAAVVEDDGRFLMIEERVGGHLLYNQPAGHLESGESLLEAVVRETLEETAREFDPRWLVGVYRWRHPRKDVTYLRFCFAGSCGAPIPGRALDAGIERALWASRDALLAESARLRSPLVLRCIDDYLAGRRFPLAILRDLDPAPATGATPAAPDGLN